MGGIVQSKKGHVQRLIRFINNTLRLYVGPSIILCKERLQSSDMNSVISINNFVQTHDYEKRRSQCRSRFCVEKRVSQLVQDRRLCKQVSYQTARVCT